MLSSVVFGETVVVDDHFDDGAIGSNTTGVGEGFNVVAGLVNSTVTEADSKVTLNGPTHGGSRCSITSKDGAVLGGVLSRFEFLGVRFAVGNTGTGATARNCIGVKQGNDAWDFDDGLPTGFWVQFENTSLTTADGSGGWNGTSVLFYEANDNTKTVLATWTFNTLNWNTGTQNLTPILDIILDLGPDGYELTIEGDTVTLLSGSLSGSFPEGFTNEVTEGCATAYIQSENPGINISIDRIIITEGVTSGPYDPTPEDGEPTAGEVFDLNTADVTLGWKGGKDPQDVYPIDPAIHGYYIYLLKLTDFLNIDLCGDQ